MPPDRPARCFLCKAPSLEPTGRMLRYGTEGRERRFALACASCGLLVERADDGEEAREVLLSRLVEGRFRSRADDPFGLDIYTLRIAASLRSLAVAPADGAQAEALRHPHSPLAADARLEPLARLVPDRVALGLLCRPGELDALLPSLRDHGAWATEIVVLLDAPAGPDSGEAMAVPGLTDGAVRCHRRPLAGNFGAQRDALAQLSDAPWMLQLDADERLEAETGARLPRLAAQAARDGLVSVGLPRRNVVGGIASALYPDVQYRLNRREIRFEGRVHERPRRPWQHSTVALGGDIRHDLDRQRVVERSGRYEAMAPGGGRRDEMALLLEPYGDERASARR